MASFAYKGKAEGCVYGIDAFKEVCGWSPGCSDNFCNGGIERKPTDFYTFLIYIFVCVCVCSEPKTVFIQSKEQNLK